METKNLTVRDDLDDVVFDTNQINQISEKIEEQNINDFKCTFVEGLENDENVIGYKYVLLSTISPENILNCDVWGLKIKGFEDKEEMAEKKAELMRKKDKFFDVYVGVNGSWHPLVPTSKQIENEKYGNEKLNKIMKKVHESEKKEKKEEQNNEVKLDNEYDIIKNLSQRKNNLEDDGVVKQNINFQYENEDCLDEDPIIPDKRFAIVSFLSPELAINCKERYFKIRGYTHSLQKAYQLAEKLKEKDETFNLTVVEIGKWTAINFKLMSKMKQYNETELSEKQQYDLKILNEIIGRYRKNIEDRKEILQKRKMEQIKKGAEELNNEGENIENCDNINNESEITTELSQNRGSAKDRLQNLINSSAKLRDVSEKKESKGETENETTHNDDKKKEELRNTNRFANTNRNHDPRERMEKIRKKIAENKEKNKDVNNTKIPDKQLKIKQEVNRINEKKQNLEELKIDKEKLESNLNKMRQMLEQKMAKKN